MATLLGQKGHDFVDATWVKSHFSSTEACNRGLTHRDWAGNRGADAAATRVDSNQDQLLTHYPMVQTKRQEEYNKLVASVQQMMLAIIKAQEAIARGDTGLGPAKRWEQPVGIQLPPMCLPV